MKRLVSTIACVLFFAVPAVADVPVPKPKPASDQCLGPSEIFDIFETEMAAIFDPLPMPAADSLAYLDVFNAYPPVSHAPADAVLIFVAKRDVRLASVPVPEGGGAHRPVPGWLRSGPALHGCGSAPGHPSRFGAGRVA